MVSTAKYGWPNHGLATDGHLEDACLGIDIGSHRTRVCIWRMRTKTEVVVENPQYYNHGGAYTPCDFPSALYVFDDVSQPVYLLDDDDTARRCVSAKYVFYFLANASDALLEQYPPVRLLMERKDDPEFRAQLRRAMVALLSVLHDATAAVCRNQGLRIVKIGLTIPVQWGLAFEDVYRSLVVDVFDIPDATQIYFFTETEALSRYLYKHHARMLDPRDQHNAILFFDFGGHNMNGCLFGVARDDGRPDGNSFFRVGSPFGAGGGSEQWEHHTTQWFLAQYFQVAGVPAPPHQLEQFLFNFRRQKGKETGLRKAISISLALPGDAGIWRATFTLEDINQTWERGLNGPLRTARREISRLVDRIKQGLVSSPLVVVSGGTARNPAVKSSMSDLCNEKGISLVFTDEFNVRIRDESAKVAKAAAYVVSESLTVEKFFQRGAAIGLQMRQAREQGKPKTEIREWDDTGTLLLDMNGRPHIAQIAVRSSDEFRLICDPFFNRLPRDQRLRVAADRSYDLVYLGKRKQGTWAFHLLLRRPGSDDNDDDDNEHDDEDDKNDTESSRSSSRSGGENKNNNMQIHLQQFYQKRRNTVLRLHKTLRLPLYFDGNSSCVHVGDRNRDISELALDLPPQPTVWGEEMEGDDDDDDDDDDNFGEQESDDAQGSELGLMTSSL